MFNSIARKQINLQYPPSPISAKALGDWAENLACEWLTARGLKIKARNVRSKYGEIDLIMTEHNCLIFVEVRYRKNANFGSAEASITPKKCQRLTAAAQHYLIARNFGSDTSIRFDAVAISPSKESHLHCTINWIQNILG